jgi:hypothetical protein
VQPKISKRMESSPKYPVGIQSFEKIRTSGMLYVDKTDLIYKMTHAFESVFLSRPRRFGKTLLTRTIQSYFEGRKELFEGLAMERLETEWTKHPVLHFDFGGLKEESVANLKERLGEMLEYYEDIYVGERRGSSLGGRFAKLIRRAYEQTGQRVVLLIDEYDVPMLHVLTAPHKIAQVRTVMHEFYSQIKPSNDYLRFVFLTGISTFSQLGMFSELNNLVNITNMNEYAAICGITLPELKDNFQYGIHQLATECRCTADEMAERLREQYDGYHFTDKMVDIFNPFSLLNAFVAGRLDDYWFQTGTPTFVIDMLRARKGQWKFNVEDIDNTEPMAFNRFSTPLEQARGPIPFLYQAGYLTIKACTEEKKYVLGVPNTEVRLGLLHNLIPLYSAMDPDDALDRSIDISAALRNGDYDSALRMVQSFLAAVPFMEGDREILANQEQREAYYHRLLFIIFSLLHNGARAQVRQAVGMPDIVVTTRQYIYIIEVKLDSTPEVALQQIEEKHYAAPYLTEGKQIIKLGVNFSSATRTLGEWKRGSSKP